jgi:hypothetical protein
VPDRVKTPAFELLEPRVLLSADTLESGLGDFGDSLAAPSAIQFDLNHQTSVQGIIGSISDKDVFSFLAPVTGGLRVDMAADGNALDSLVQAYDANGRRVAINNNYLCGNLDASLSMAVQAGQTYYIQASGYRSTLGDYRLDMLFAEDEFGNSLSQAGVIELDAEGGTFSSGIDYRGDYDYIRFVAPVSGAIGVQMSAAAGSVVDSYLVAYNSSGRTLSANNDYARNIRDARVSFLVEAGQTYYLRAMGYRGTVGDYDLTFVVAEDREGNNPAAATDITVDPDQTTTITGGVDYVYDRDYFRFVAPVSGGLTVNMQAADANLDCFLYAYDSTGRRMLARNDDIAPGNYDSRVSFYVEAGRTYYIQAKGWGRTTGDYELTFDVSVDEYGGSTSSAGQVNLDENGAASVTATFNYARDVDMLRLTATHTAGMTVTMSGLDGGVAPNVYLLDANGRALALRRAGAGQTVTMTFNAVAGQTYYLRAVNGNAYGTGSYRLDLSTDIPAPPPEPDPTIPDPTPGAVVSANVYSTEQGLLLRVVGTNENDVIVISQTANSVSVSGSLTYSYAAAVSRIEIYGFGGGDALRTTYSVTAQTIVHAGDGDDTVHENGQGSSFVYGEGGDDLLVTVGGGLDRLFGGDGLDGFWQDSTDILSDPSAAETAAKSVHRIGSFYQPYSTSPTAPDYISLAINGQNFRDPTLTGYASQYANFSNYSVFSNGPQYNDIRQGSVGDCYYLAALSSLAQQDPMILRQMVTSLGDGTFAVRFYSGSQEVYLRIDGDLPVTGGGSLAYARLSPQSEIWVPLVEKAYAFFRYGQNSYSSISGGWMDTVYRQVTGGSAEFRYTSGTLSSLATYLRTQLAAGHAVTLGSYSGATGPVVGSHAYQVVSIDDDNYVTVYNPWGVDGRSWDGNSNDGLLRLSIDMIQQNYQAVVTALV